MSLRRGSIKTPAIDANSLALNSNAPASNAIVDVIEARAAKIRNRRQERILQTSARYQDQTRRPIVCLAFVLPLIVLYEIGSILLGEEAIRSGVDQWVCQILASIGFGQVVVLPLIVTAIMVVWHHRNHDHWRFGPLVLPGMFLESIVLGLTLFWAASACHAFVTVSLPTVAVASHTLAPTQWLAANLSVLGSGIYEELFFRLLLLVPVVGWASYVTHSRQLGVVFGILFSSLIFAALHYSVFNPAGGQFEMSSFIFRFCASIVFCNLFLFRGFGIAVGAHVFYDLLTQF